MKDRMFSWVLAGLLAISIVFHLGWLNYPHQVIFDEVHFGKFVIAYCCTGQRFFDIHPPHAKLLVAAAVKLTGYHDTFSFTTIGQSYEAAVPVVALRLVPALSGIILPFIIYVLLRQMKIRREIAVLAAAAVVFENALLVQTRIIALDGILLVAQFGALAAFLAARARTGWPRWSYLILTGALCGLAVGTKFTGLAILLLLGVLCLAELWKLGFKKGQSIVTEGIVIVAMAFVVYAAGWWIHAAWLPYPGSGDAWLKPTGNVWADSVAIQKKMLSANYNLSATHPYSSVWYSWPVMKRPIFYWQGKDAAIYFLGNPLVWWGSLMGLVSLVTSIVVSWAKGKAAHLPPGAGLFVVGYIVALLPFIRIPRALFLYHYATPLLFSLLVTACCIQAWMPADTRRQRRLAIAFMVVLVGLFILFSPLTFGFQAGPEWRTLLYWFPTWR